MDVPDVTRRGILNQGAFFSPYYLFGLLARQHADELDPEGREANRRLLRRPFRAVRPSPRYYFEFCPICPAHYHPDGSSRH
jgi:hypothetical protein